MDHSLYDSPLLVDYIPPSVGTPKLTEELQGSWLGIICPIFSVEYVKVTVEAETEDLAGIKSGETYVLGKSSKSPMNRETAAGWWRGTFHVDFYSDYLSGYEVVVNFTDNNGNYQGNVQNAGALTPITEGISNVLMYASDPWTNGQLSGAFRGFRCGRVRDRLLRPHL